MMWGCVRGNGHTGTVRLISANVNGIRAATRRGGLEWLAGQQPDVLTLQEVRATEAQLTAELAGSPYAEWQLAHAPASTAGRAGVAVLTPYAIAAQHIGLSGFEDQGRWVEAVLETPAGPVRVISAYVHTGEANTPRQDEKYAFLEAVTTRLAEVRDEQVILTGDLNICHTEQDLKNWKGNRGKAGFLPDEQAYLSKWFADGWVDVTRRAAGDVEGPYTWWSWRGKAFDNDAGWRIDYAIHSPAIADRVSAVSVGRAATYAERWSDHAALVIDHRAD